MVRIASFIFAEWEEIVNAVKLRLRDSRGGGPYMSISLLRHFDFSVSSTAVFCHN